MNLNNIRNHLINVHTEKILLFLKMLASKGQFMIFYSILAFLLRNTDDALLYYYFMNFNLVLISLFLFHRILEINF